VLSSACQTIKRLLASCKQLVARIQLIAPQEVEKVICGWPLLISFRSPAFEKGWNSFFSHVDKCFNESFVNFHFSTRALCSAHLYITVFYRVWNIVKWSDPNMSTALRTLPYNAAWFWVLGTAPLFNDERICSHHRIASAFDAISNFRSNAATGVTVDCR